MDEIFENKLFKKYHKLFPKEDRKDTKRSSMCFGFECDTGWYFIVDTLCNDIQTYVDNNKDVKQITVVQVKEKFGGLRYYIHGGCTEIYDMISLAERESFTHCEICGIEGKLRQDTGWWKTYCETHYQLRLDEIKEIQAKWKKKNSN